MKHRFELIANRIYWKAVLIIPLWAMLLPVSVFAVDPGADQNKSLDIVAVVPANFPPHYSLDSDGHPKGFAIDMLDEVAKIAKLNIKYIVRDTWKEVDKVLGDGQADLIPNLGITAERQQRFSFSRPMETYPVSIFVREETSYISGIKDLSGLNVAVVQYNVAGKILKDNPGVKLKTFITSQEALFELLSGNVDAFAYPAPGARRLAKSIGVMQRIKIVGDPLIEIKRGIAVRKDNVELMTRLDAALSTFLESPSYKNIYIKWHGEQPSYWTVERVLILMGGLVFLSMVAMFVWRYVSLSKINHQLRNTVKTLKETKVTLDKSEDQVRMLLDSTVEAIYGIDVQGHCTFANPACVRFLGYDSVKDLLGQDMHKLIHHSYKDGSGYPVGNCHIYQAFHSKSGTHQDDEVFWRRDGSSFYAEYWSYPAFDEGKIVGAVVTFNDISERKQKEAELTLHREHLQELVDERTYELKNARDEALEASYVKSEFLAKMSHELRTPLNSIIGFSGIIKDGIAGPVNDEQKKQLGMVYDSAQHLLELINEVLDLSKVEAGKLEVSKSSFLLQPMLAELEDMMFMQVNKKGLSLSFDVSNAPQELFTDQGKIRQVLVNLLGNAVKFTGQGMVTLSCWRLDDGVFFSVRDTGVGIGKHHLKKVFNAFHQEEAGDARYYEGTGLGLTICKEFVELLGGEISVESKPGQGSVFTVYLPNLVEGLVTRQKTSSKSTLDSGNVSERKYH